MSQVPNINRTERRRRLAAGVLIFAASCAGLIALIGAAANRRWRLLLFPLFTGAAIGYFQWRDAT